jgi:hypothetical protein
MTSSALRLGILKALEGSSSQMPVDLTKIHSLIVPKIKLAELIKELEDMCVNRELQTCNGIKGGKEYVCYWVSGMPPPAWRSSQKVAVDKSKKAK